MECSCCKKEKNCRLLCSKCGSFDSSLLQKNPFDLFQLPCRFKLDQKRLEQEYRELSREVHPDYHRDKPKEVQTRILNLCSRINCAYKELKCPFNRAQMILLQLGGKDFVPDKRKLPPRFLMEILDLQEEVDSLRRQGEQSIDRLEEIEADVSKQLNGVYSRLNEQFSRMDKIQDSEKAALAEEIQVELNMINYYRRILQDIERILEDV